MVEGYLLSVYYDRERETAAAKLYIEEENEVRIVYLSREHRPYLLTNIPPEKLSKMPEVVGHKGFLRVEEVTKHDILKDIDVTLTKVVAKDPLAIGGRAESLREVIKRVSPGAKVWEADIKYRNCYIYDKLLIPGMRYRAANSGELELIKPRISEEKEREILSKLEDKDKEALQVAKEIVMLLEEEAPSIEALALDIEVETTQHNVIPDPKEARQRVISIGLASSDSSKPPRILLLAKSHDLDEEYIKQSSILKNAEIVTYADEKALIMEALKVLEKAPLLVTFNGTNFDLPYLRHRAQKLGIPDSDIPIVAKRDHYTLRKGVHIDLHKVFSNKSLKNYVYGGRYREVSLDAVSQAILGERKRTPPKEFTTESITRIAEYCLYDTLLTLKLFTYRNNMLLKLLFLFMRISKLSIEDVASTGISNWIKNMMYFELRRRRYLIPTPEEVLNKGRTVTTAKIKGKKYLGAIVIKPKPGAFFNVACLDFASLYPSIIRKYRISFETINCPHSACKSNRIPEVNHWICKKVRGIFPLIVGILRDIRVGWYKSASKDKRLPEDIRSWYEAVQQSLKVFLNASYGVSGAETYPLYCPPVAESIAALGRYAIQKSLEIASAMGVEVLYGDTDSLFIKIRSEEDVEKLEKEIESKLGMDLELDKIYRYTVFSERKKNYLGVSEDGTVDVKGMTGKKRNTPRFIREAFQRALEELRNVKTPDDLEKAKLRIIEIVREARRKLVEKRLTLEELAFEVMLSKPLDKYEKTTPQHVKAAKMLQERGEIVATGKIIAYVKTKTREGVKPIELATIDEIDVEKYEEYLFSTFEQLLDALGIDYETLRTKTATLDQFF